MNQALSDKLKIQVEKGIAILKQGGIIAFPTDTVYGLGCSIFNESAVRRIYEVKQRPLDMALPVLISSLKQLSYITVKMPGVVNCIAEKFWPGPLTLVLLKSNKVPGIVTAEANTVAVRMPAHPIPLAIIKGMGEPIIGTSANISGRPSPATARDVFKQLGSKIELIIDGGISPGGKESTILDLTPGNPVVLREGPVSLVEIKSSCNIP